MCENSMHILDGSTQWHKHHNKMFACNLHVCLNLLVRCTLQYSQGPNGLDEDITIYVLKIVHGVPKWTKSQIQ